jgi:hypothetical protein
MAHFATFPAELPARCIAASCPAEVCTACGKARERVIRKGLTAHDGATESAYAEGSTANRLALLRQASRARGGEYANGTETTGWTDCGCGAPWAAGVVLDPFAGSATTLVEARRLGRQAIGIEISSEYVAMSVDRLEYGVRGAQAILAGQAPLEALALPPLVPGAKA